MQVTWIYSLSALPPSALPSAILCARRMLKFDGRMLVRDYAYGDLAQVGFLRFSLVGEALRFSLVGEALRFSLV